MPSPSSGFRRLLTHPALGCALAVAVCVLAARPGLEMGFNDDFSYIFTAKKMAETGRFVYNAWSSPIIGWQACWGALFIKLFGFSFNAVRASSLILAMATAALLQRLFVRLGVHEWNATLATLTLTLSPLFLPLAFSFMTDVPAFFVMLVCFYACIRAVAAKSDKATLQWLIFAALSNAIGGTARQIAWLGALVLVPSTAWFLRRRRGALLTGAILWIASIAFIYACMQWFKMQPYSINDQLISGNHLFSRNYFAILLFSLPVLAAFLVRYPIRQRWAQIHAGAAILIMALGTGLCAVLWHRGDAHAISFLLAPFSDEWITRKGLELSVLPGRLPDVLSLPLRVAVTLLSFAASLAFLICLVHASRFEKRPEGVNIRQLPDRTLLYILGPVTAAYLFVLMTHASFFERYFLQLIFPLLVVAMLFYQQRIAARLPATTLVLIVLFAIFGVAALHDQIAAHRARLAAADQLRAAGVSRNQIRAGVEYDGWTQIELAGHVNDPRVRIPANSFRPLPPQPWPSSCAYWFDSWVPDIHTRYELSFDPSPCFPESEFPPLAYTTWLAPRQHRIYILKLPQ